MHRKAGLIRLKKDHLFDIKTIDFGISMTKIGPKGPEETNKRAKGDPK